MKVELEKSNEAAQTSLLAIRQMTPGNRLKFYQSEEGQNIVKGLILESETNKKAKADGMNWTPEELEATIIALREASEDNWKIFLQLLPGPVAARISEHVNTARANNGLNKSADIEKGARIGSAGYELWLAKRRQHMNVKHSADSKPMSGGSKTPKIAAPPKVASPKGPKSPKPVGYGKFISKKPKKD